MTFSIWAVLNEEKLSQERGSLSQPSKLISHEQKVA